MKKTLLLRLVALVAVSGVLASWLLAPHASAQYPTPQGSLICNLGQSSQPNTTVPFSVTLLDISGAPVPSQPVTFSLLTGPGASLTSTQSVTDPSGIATTSLFTGSDPGNLSVSASTSEVGCNAVSEVLSSVVSPSILPGVGGQAAASATSSPSSFFVLAAALALVGTGVLLVRRRTS